MGANLCHPLSMDPKAKARHIQFIQIAGLSFLSVCLLDYAEMIAPVIAAIGSGFDIETAIFGIAP